MTPTAVRRQLRGGVVLALGAVLVGAHSVAEIALQRTNIFSGWLLLISMFVLALLNVNKKLSPLPLGRTATWLQIHVYVGLLSVVIFVLHTGARIPNGGLETSLAVLFTLVAGTGIIGLALSRTLPQILSRRGEEVIFERIPIFRRQLEQRAEDLVLQSVSEGKSSVIADFHVHRLAEFLARPKHFWGHLTGSARTCEELIRDFAALDRYLNEAERAIRRKLEDIIRKKNDLDFHYACQAALKGWLFIHIPLTFSLIIMGVLHAVVVYAFSGGLR